MKKIAAIVTLSVLSLFSINKPGFTQQTVGNCSINSNTPTTIEFDNDTNLSEGVVIEIYWLDYECNRVLYNTLAPGESYVQETFVTHPWIAVSPSEGDKVLGQFIPTAPDPVFISFE